jgi:2-keto-myo-inositol isomerase
VKDVAMDNVGMVVDTFHFYANDSKLEDLRQIDGRKIFIFHINDAEDVPKDQLKDVHRLYPGAGVIPLRDIVSALRETGYNHMVSIEIFRPEYWELDPQEVAAKAKEGAERFCK